MKNVKILSLGIAMLICFVPKAQHKTVSENNSLQTKIIAKSFTKSKDTIPPVKVSSNFAKTDSALSFRIVCAKTFSHKDEPLYRLDGRPINAKQIAAINPNDIQYIKVLRDTTATLIYGNQARNGAIIITTKKKYHQNNKDD